MHREYEITVRKGPDDWGTFRFNADNKELAHAHAMTLKGDPWFRAEHGDVMVSENVNEKVRHIAVRFVGWVE